MKIAHCCLAAFYIDNYGYQENILPKIHKLQGHDVSIIASTETYVDNKNLGYINASSYVNENAIPVTRLPYISCLPHAVVKKLRVYKGLIEKLEEIHPDVIFLHDIQFLGVYEIVKYLKKHPKVKVYADGHTDFINSARGFISKNILHKIIYKWCAKTIEPYVDTFWGVTPLRVDFFSDVYGIDKSKVDLLVLGVDDSEIDFSKKDKIRTEVRQKLQINEDDFVIVTGGKIDARKNIHLLMESVNELKFEHIKLLIFGTPDEEMKDTVASLSQSNKVISIGWIAPSAVYDYFFASDLAFFPGTHSVLWEQAVGVGLPCVFKRWDGMQHIDVGENCILMDEVNVDAITRIVTRLIEDDKLMKNMQDCARTKGIKTFSYQNIAAKAIGELNSEE